MISGHYSRKHQKRLQQFPKKTLQPYTISTFGTADLPTEEDVSAEWH